MSLWLRVRLLASLVVLGLLMISGFVTLDRALSRTEVSSQIVNLSGRQRMLSTRIDALMTRLVVVEDRGAAAALIAELETIVDTVDRVHRGLLDGDRELGLPPSDSEAVRAIYRDAPHDLDRSMAAYLALVGEALRTGATDPDALAGVLPRVWTARDTVVAGLEALTSQFEIEGRDQLRLIEWIERGMLGVLLASLVGMWVFNFRPMERRIVREQEALRGIMENVADGIITIDSEGMVRSFNPAAETIFGYAAAEIVGRNVHELMPEPDRSAHDGYIRSYVSTGDGKIVGRGPREVSGRHKDGRVLPLDLSIGEMRAGSERLFVGVTRDISARKQAADELRSSRERLEIFVRHTPAAIAMFDLDMRYIVHSERWRTDYGLGDTPIVGRSHYELFPDVPERWKEVHRRCLEGVVERCEEDPFPRADGTLDWIRWEIHPWYDVDDRVGGIIMFTEVITARKEAEEAVNVLTRAIEAASCGILVTDARTEDNSLIYVNPEFERITGYAKSEAIGRNCRFLQGDDREQPGIDDLRVAISEGRSCTVLLRNYRKDGTLFWNQTAIAPVRDRTGEIVNFVGIVTDMTDRIASEDALRRSEERYRSLYNETPVMLHSIDPQGRLIAVSDYWLRKMGYERDEVIGRPSTEFLTEEAREFAAREVLPKFFETGRCDDVPYTFIRKDGSRMEVELSAVADSDESGNILRSLAVIIDVTDKVRAESELRQIQKLEAIGQLTGGIAHDFNNLLAVVMGSLQLIERRSAGNERVLPLVANALGATKRGAELTQQLLAYARRQPLSPTMTDVNELIGGMESMLRRTLGETVEIRTGLAGAVAPVMVDHTQLESALLNLVINARDAMPDGGCLLIETEEAELDERYVEHHLDVVPGPYVVISVTDSGVGMAADVREHIFEPFYTTKGVGKGTGLGLSMVYGFVKQSKGNIQVYSEPGLGTTFRIYLPQASDQDADGGEIVSHDIPPAAGETILVVEDEKAVRETNVMVLEDLGYRVIEAADGSEAMDVLRSDTAIDVLFSDIVMPGGISGVDLAEAAIELRPGIKVLLTSGYPRDKILGERSSFELVRKPSTDRELAGKLRELIESEREGVSQRRASI